MRANIWIRKENERKWHALQDKSAWVNDQLKRSGVKELLVDRAKIGKLDDAGMEKAIKPVVRKMKDVHPTFFKKVNR